MRRISIPIGMLAAWGFFAPALADEVPAAKLVSAQGPVMANQGKEFVAVKSGVRLTPGDRVLVLEGGQATVEFAGGCVAVVPPGKVITIPVQSPCVNGVAVLQEIDPQLTGPVGGADAEFDQTDLLIAGGTVAGLIGLWIAFDDDGNGGGVSP